MSEINSGTIFHIQPYSVHDGPGVRTVVFLKGCPLNCLWCSNPESIEKLPQIRTKGNLCEPGCVKCVGACLENKAIEKNASSVLLDFRKCRFCTIKSCISVCRTGAIELCGKEISVSDAVSEILKDRKFFGAEGGLTLSGGEPFMQADFTIELLERIRNAGISTAVETSLYAPFSVIEKALPYISFFIFDIKLINDDLHKHYCGVSNEIILRNIVKLAEIARIPLLPRMPVIPGITDTAENIDGLSEFLMGNKLKYINLLPYMKMGIPKYAQIGKQYQLESTPVPDRHDMEKVRSKFVSNGMTVL
ncbi:MAG: glycyl-radical enzyme activating protein [Candidatus Riflebacteria bacterium]|nr:glycyl-radical enzyme activating protein [Candidatus Riflebacteria bacterium]